MNTPKVAIKRTKSKTPRATKGNVRKRPQNKLKLSIPSLRKRLFFLTLEMAGLAFTGFSAVIIALGYSANWFSGTGFFSSLLPFASGILILIVVMALLLTGWHKLRNYLASIKPVFIPIFPVILALTISGFASQNHFTQAFGNFRTLVGGKQEAGRVTLAHQIYAAYRRYEPEQLTVLLIRAKQYDAAIEEAAKAYSLDPNLLQGVAATESSFLPRDSVDGGRGLFQITQVPKAITAQVEKQIIGKISLNDARHNAFIAAATLKYYLAQMHGDLFLGLLAYNIGPANGGLKSIMQQYGATDFVTIQPYLQKLPRDYPIRVLSNALAFRIWQKEGRLLAYEEGNNALRIQSIGIPGLLLKI